MVEITSSQYSRESTRIPGIERSDEKGIGSVGGQRRTQAEGARHDI